MPFELAPYLARIALPRPPAPDAAGLIALQRAHRLAIPFENLDIFLGREIAIDSDAVFAKLVTAGRGGYCFEHDRLFGDALAALGVAVRPLLARVWLGAHDAVPPLTHALSLVTIDGQEWIADAGFGGSYVPPIPLADGEIAATPDGATYRLGRDPLHGWMLDRTIGGGTWQPQYSFTLAPVFPADLALSNLWTSTARDSRFTRRRSVSLVLPSGFASLTDRAYHRRAGDGETSAEIDDPRVYRMRLGLMFGIALDADEIAALGLFGAR